MPRANECACVCECGGVVFQVFWKPLQLFLRRVNPPLFPHYASSTASFWGCQNRRPTRRVWGSLLHASQRKGL